MNGAAPFRSHLMQQFAAQARNQSRPPIALFSMGSNNSSSSGNSVVSSHNASDDRLRRNHRCTTSKKNTSVGRQAASSSQQLSSVSTTSSASQVRRSYDSTVVRYSSTKSSVAEEANDKVSTRSSSTLDNNDTLSLSQDALHFQNLITSRRTISNYSNNEQHHNDTAYLRAAIRRGVQCAVSAPNHKLTQPTTYHCILSPSTAYDTLLDIVYEVTLHRLKQQQLCGEEACINEARRKREKWSSVPAFLAVTVNLNRMDNESNTTSSSVVDTTNSTSSAVTNHEEGYNRYAELPFNPTATPYNTRQMEDYASACASIQNLLLSLHSEGLGSKWATGPIIRTDAFRELIHIDNKEGVMVVGLIFIGWSKNGVDGKRMPRRRRVLDGDVLREV